MLEHLRPAVSLVALSTVFFGLACPLAFVAAGHVAPGLAQGSLIMRDGHAVGSALIGQDFTSPRYLHGRPSAITGIDPKHPGATIPTPYDASTSLASNLAPTSKVLHDRIASDLDALRKRGLAPGAVPVDATTASGSGLDPDISPDYALLQARPVAAARGLPEASVRNLIEARIQPRILGLFGEPCVNVLRVNLALDHLPPGGQHGAAGQVAGVVH